MKNKNVKIQLRQVHVPQKIAKKHHSGPNECDRSYSLMFNPQIKDWKSSKNQRMQNEDLKANQKFNKIWKEVSTRETSENMSDNKTPAHICNPKFSSGRKKVGLFFHY